MGARDFPRMKNLAAVSVTPIRSLFQRFFKRVDKYVCSAKNPTSVTVRAAPASRLDQKTPAKKTTLNPQPDHRTKFRQEVNLKSNYVYVLFVTV